MVSRSRPPIRWVQGAGTDGGRWAMEGVWFVGQVVHYDVPEGWAAQIHSVSLEEGRVAGGPWTTVEAAQQAFEVAFAALGRD